MPFQSQIVTVLGEITPLINQSLLIRGWPYENARDQDGIAHQFGYFGSLRKPAVPINPLNTVASCQYSSDLASSQPPFRGRDQEDATELFVCLGKGPALKSAIIVQHLKTES